MFKWLRAFSQTTTYLGLAMIAAVWTGVILLANQERERASQDGTQQGSKLTRVFEEYISRVIKGTDSQLLLLRDFYEHNPERFGFTSLAESTKSLSDLTIHFSLTGPDGIIKLSSLGPMQSRGDISQLEPFTVQQQSAADQLYISTPVVGQISGKPSIQLTRRLTAPDGSFGGTIGASLDVLQLETFYSSIDMGQAGVIALVGFDGIIRARTNRTPRATTFIGTPVSQSKMLENYRKYPVGSYWSLSNSTGRFEGINRLISYRVVEGLPLIALVGLAESDVFRRAASQTRRYFQIGFGFTAFVLFVIGFGGARQLRLDAAVAALETSKRSLERTNSWFDAALKNMAHGLCMFDRNQRLIICNRRYAELYGLTPEQTMPGTTLCAILEARVAAGRAPADAQRYIESRLEEVSRSEPCYVVDQLDNGRVYAISHRPMQEGGWVAIHEDLTDIRAAEGRAEMATRELVAQRHAMDQAVMVSLTDAEWRITFVNDKFCLSSGYPAEEVLGANHRIFVSGVHSADFFRSLYGRIMSGEIWRGEICNKAKDGSLYWIDTTIVPRFDQEGKLLAYMAISMDITVRKHAEAQFAYLDRHDALTGIANRAVLLEKMEEAAARLRRQGEAFTIFVLDLDGFKYINDTLGHSGGDELLKQLAQRLKSSIRGFDVLARLGGDEFAIIQIGATNQREGAIGLANRLLELIATPFDLDGHNVTIGTSIGIALAPESGIDSGELLKRADLALYRAKSEGRNNFTFFDAEMSGDSAARVQLLTDMRGALLRNEFELHYQPIFDTKTRRTCGMEALVRWRHPVAGVMAPDGFIWLAEESGLMEPLGDWILEKACEPHHGRTTSRWRLICQPHNSRRANCLT
jgi:diguanylate cyclase (GGDEF)-like protein/PAS domain S-box-containing protein